MFELWALGARIFVSAPMLGQVCGRIPPGSCKAPSLYHSQRGAAQRPFPTLAETKIKAG